MIIQSGSPRKWNVKHFEQLQSNERIKELLAHMHIISLDAEEIALRADAQLLAQQSPRRRPGNRRTYSAPGKLAKFAKQDIQKLSKMAMTNKSRYRKGRKSSNRLNRQKSFSPRSSHPLDLPRTPPQLIKTRSVGVTMHRRLRTSLNQTGFNNKWQSTDDSMSSSPPKDSP